MKTFQGNIVDVHKRRIFKGTVYVENQKIRKIEESDNQSDQYIIPGLIDSHVHIESSMLIPSEFSKLVIKNGTVAVISDPHEIANVMGIKGVEFMINNSKKSPLKTFFCIPSCVPATDFETSGATIDKNDIDKLFKLIDVKIMGEMMNFPGVINNDKKVHDKLAVAKKHDAVIDGHIPGITDDKLIKYIAAGISTDHECFSYEEAVTKIKSGMKILIREGSAAKNFDELFPLISEFNKMCMLCTDDSHPDDIIKYGHINKIIKKGINKNLDIFDLLTCATINPVNHYKLPVGLLRENDPADFIIINNLKDFEIIETVINGNIVYSNNRILYYTEKEKPINNFHAKKITEDQILLPAQTEKVKVIEVIDKELLTNSFITHPKTKDNNIISDTERDILKIVVYNRYSKTSKPAIGLINGFGLHRGAMASSIAHDSHNIIAVGADDTEIVNAINEIINSKGGLVFYNSPDFYSIPLEFAGLMTAENPYTVAEKYEILNKQLQTAGSKLTSAFMTLSFMALLVIPSLKIGDQGLFDVDNFKFTDLYVK